MIRHAARIEPYEAARSLRESIFTLARRTTRPGRTRDCAETMRRDKRACRTRHAALAVTCKGRPGLPPGRPFGPVGHPSHQATQLQILLANDVYARDSNICRVSGRPAVR